MAVNTMARNGDGGYKAGGTVKKFIMNCESSGKYRTYAFAIIEIINNTRGGIEGKIGKRGVWGANSSPGCSLIYDVPDKKVVLDGFFYFLNCFSRKNIKNIIKDCLKQ